MTKLAPIILPDGNVLNKDYLFTHGTDIRDDIYEAILAGMKRAYYDPLQEWAQLCSFLYDYSPSNQTLLAYQAAARGIQPRFYASYKRWEAIGQQLYDKPYRVGKIEDLGYKAKAFWIWVPKYRKPRDAPDEYRLTGFSMGWIFGDCAIVQGQEIQKDGSIYEHPPLPDFSFAQKTDEEISSIYHALRLAMTMEGWRVTEIFDAETPVWEWESDNEHGLSLRLNRSYDQQLLLTGLIQANAWKRLVALAEEREVTRELLSSYTFLCAHIVCLAFGIQSHLSYELIDQWYRSINGDEKRQINTDLTTIQLIAKTLILRIRKILNLPNLVIESQVTEK